MKKKLLFIICCALSLSVGNQLFAQVTQKDKATTAEKKVENNEPSAVITAKELSYDFGTIKEEGGPVSHEFTITNTGNAPLVINNVRASCGCTTPKWTKEAIKPGETGMVSATYNPLRRPGVFNKTITISSNANPSTMILHINGAVEK